VTDRGQLDGGGWNRFVAMVIIGGAVIAIVIDEMFSEVPVGARLEPAAVTPPGPAWLHALLLIGALVLIGRWLILHPPQEADDD